MRFFKRRKKYIEVDPDEIFLDSSNLPDFDRSQFEGRIERPIAKRVPLALGLFFLLALALFTFRGAMLQIVSGEAFAVRAEENRLGRIPIFAARGVIYDRNKIPLAWNEPLETTSSSTEPFAKRTYTEKSGFAHVLGYVQYPSKDNSGFFYKEDFEGKAGAEKSYNQVVAGRNGERIVEIDARQRIQSENTIEPPQDGHNMILSIDARIQEEMAREIAGLAERAGFTGGAGAIMDIHTGELIALTSYPEYDPNVISLGEDAKEISRQLNDTKNKPFLDRFISGLYTPGSIVKPIFALGALHEKIVSPNKQFLATGALILPNPYFPDKPSVFKDWKAHGWVDMRRAIAVSSDEYFYIIGGGYKDQAGLGIARIEKYARLFGYSEKTGIALDGEGSGTIPNPEWKAKNFNGTQWLIGDTYHTAIGQYGFLVTPIQALRAVAGVANGGTLLVPHIVRAIEPPGVEASSTDYVPSAVRQTYRQIEGISEREFGIVREGMRASVMSGVAKGLSTDAVAIAAKTGTAELGAKKNYVNSWVTGFWPYEHPRYAFTVVMERGPVANTTGALYVMRRVIDWMTVYAPEYLKEGREGTD